MDGRKRTVSVFFDEAWGVVAVVDPPPSARQTKRLLDEHKLRRVDAPIRTVRTLDRRERIKKVGVFSGC